MSRGLSNESQESNNENGFEIVPAKKEGQNSCGENLDSEWRRSTDVVVGVNITEAESLGSSILWSALGWTTEIAVVIGCVDKSSLSYVGSK